MKDKFIKWRNTLGYLVTLINNIPKEKFMNKTATIENLSELIDYIDEQKVDFIRGETMRGVRELEN